MFDVFWWCSAIARLDMRDSSDGIAERTPYALRRGVSVPEEVTTFNFVRQLASYRRRHGQPVAAALHSRALEGGRRGMRPPSGADLELAIETYPGEWVDLLLQAKRLYLSGRYEQWKNAQVEDLRRWAATHGGRTPAMLLYNAQFPPFGAPGTRVVLGGCCSSPVQRHGWKWPRWWCPDGRSPATFTLAILPSTGTLPAEFATDGLDAAVVNSIAMPLECIFCTEHELGLTSRPGWPPPLPIRDTRPEWASELLEAGGIQGPSPFEDAADELESASAVFSVVLPYAVEDE